MHPDQVRSVWHLLLWHVSNLHLQTRAVYELYAQGSNYSKLHATNQLSQPLWERYVEDTSFRFLVTSSQHKIPQTRQRQIIESFAYMGFLGKIDMKNPDINLTVFEECKWESNLKACSDLTIFCHPDDERHGTTRVKHEGDGQFREVFFGRLVCPPLDPNIRRAHGFL